MKNKYLLIPALFMMLSSCSFSGDTNGNPVRGYPEAGTDLIEVDESATYYESKDITMWLEVSGFYTSAKYFTLDEENENLRVYDNMYFYKDDYFFFLSNDMRDWYADMNTETEYAVKELAEGEDYHIKFLSDGIYRVTFDLTTKKCDVTFKSQIETPKYFTIKNSQIVRYANSRAMVEVKMETNPDNPKELRYLNYQAEVGYVLYFMNSVHTSTYKITLDEASLNVTAKYGNSKRSNIRTLVGGSLNIYLNIETYIVRVEQAS